MTPEQLLKGEIMNRIHSFEWGDQPWFSDTLRLFMTDVLQYQMDTWHIYQPAISKIKFLLEKTKQSSIVDLCSGSGGPFAGFITHLKNDHPSLKVYLTDKFPHAAEQTDFGNFLEYLDEAVEANNVPPHLEGVRTIFSAFHHFSPEKARMILQDAVHSESAIGVFEFTERKWINVLKVLFIVPLSILFQTPFIRPFSIQRLFWTYCIPAVPLFSAWDATVSHLRSYSVAELRKLSSGLNSSENYTWIAGQSEPATKTGIKVTWLLGYPSA